MTETTHIIKDIKEVSVAIDTWDDIFSDFDPDLDKIREELIVTKDWSGKEFFKVSKRLKRYDYDIRMNKEFLNNLRDFFSHKIGFLLRLLENPNVLEHESFTELLRAVFHLAEELTARKDLLKLPDTDYKHLAGDIKRAYRILVYQWLDYMKYMKGSYPYLFSLAVRQNPFDQNASPIVLS